MRRSIPAAHAQKAAEKDGVNRTARSRPSARSARSAAQSYRVNTGKDGRFLFHGVPEGRYRLFEIRVYTNAKKGECEVMERRNVTVGPNGLDLGTVKLKPKIIPPAAK